MLIKKIIPLLLFMFLINSCSKDSEVVNFENDNTTNNNRKPTIELLSPENNFQYNASTSEVTLSWKGNDADNDNLNYTVFFGTNELKSLISNSSLTEHTVKELNNNTTYQWRVDVSDGKSTVSSSVFNFSIKKPVESIKGVKLTWQNLGASYDLYFGENSADTKILSNTNENKHLFKDLEVGKKYYYKVVAKGVNYTFQEHYFYYRETGVSIFDGNVTLKDQDAIKTFGRNRYTEITGYLQIKQNYKQDITELGWLQDLKYVGSLSLSYISNLQSLYGLHNISSIRGTLRIENIPEIDKIVLDKLLYISGSLIISGNRKLQQISMSRLRNIYGDLTIGGKITLLVNDKYGYSFSSSNAYGNPILTKINFDNLVRVRGNINFHKNESLNNLSCLSKIEGSYKDLIIWNNDELTDISALSNFKTCAGSLAIVGNDRLTNLVGLDNLNIVSYQTLISENKKLSDISLPKLEKTFIFHIVNNPELTSIKNYTSFIEAGTLSIYSNQNLSDFCGLYNFFKYGNYTRGYHVENNKYNPTRQDILDGNCSK